MLVLTRKPDEGILLGEDIRITVLGVDGERVRLGIDAPKSMRIFRMELLEQTQAVNKEAADAKVIPLDFTRFQQKTEKTDQPRDGGE